MQATHDSLIQQSIDANRFYDDPDTTRAIKRILLDELQDWECDVVISQEVYGELLQETVASLRGEFGRPDCEEYLAEDAVRDVLDEYIAIGADISRAKRNAEVS